MDPKLVLKTCFFCVLCVMTLGMYMIFNINVHCILVFYVINYQCQTELDTKHPWVKGIRVCPIDGARHFPLKGNPLNCCSLT